MKLSTTISTTAASLLLAGGLYAAPADAATFKDVPENYWAHQQIEQMVQKGIITGYGDQTFKGAAPVTRAQTATMIAKAIKADTAKTGSVAFKDVSAYSSSYPYIVALTNKGVFADTAQFNPQQSINRAQLAKVLVRAFDLKGQSRQSFKDVPKSHWAYKEINTLAATGIMSGTSKGQFQPHAKVTRSQMAVYISNALKYLNPEEKLGGTKDKVAGAKTTAPSAKAHSELEQEILLLVNKERAKKGAQPLKFADDVDKVAQLKSEDMVKKKYFDHFSPTYGSPFEMMEKYGVSYTMAGENIAAGYTTASAVMEGWMNSPGHRANIMNPEYKEIGIGIAKGGSYGTYYTQMFVKR
ncbi:putative YkwD family protein [Bacillus ectoiniformans]|uniref:S-layer homology domain-containing protein n=1 Tax=Bacillus ectoiniformans TaxID=1494429 RepID=UPI001959BC61|nr:S-layer homology domain-containing protein [Bacillus ectoiniformans]MBM7648704.1 putative YkwD family protein [Bacillus ectoiniformans]